MEKLRGLARLSRRVREMHELSMTLERVDLLQRGVTEALVSNRNPKGRKILEKFESTACMRCCLESVERF